jgi:hypothetical protein
VKTFLKLNVLITLPNPVAGKKPVSTNHAADYPDLKKFVAEFENAFPNMRLVNVTVEPRPATGDERLTFGADVITLLTAGAK